MTEPRPALDVYLLRVLHTLLTERSVTRAAVKLNQSQPAVSAALRRLREITGDALLVRSRAGMAPTEHGATLLEPAASILRELDRIAAPPMRFDPLRSARTFRIGSPDYLNVLFVPTILRCLRQQAPAARLEWLSLSPAFDYERALETGDLDLAIGNWPEPPDGLRRAQLFVDRMVCLMAASNPLASSPLSLAEYLAAPHLAPTPYASTQRDIVDQHLARDRLKRRVAVCIPFFGLIPYALVDSDLIFTTTAFFARHYADSLPLTVREPPIDFPPMHYYQLWHERTHFAPEIGWLRGIVTEATRILTATHDSDAKKQTGIGHVSPG